MNVNKIRLIGLYTIDLPIAVAHPSDSYILKGADGFGPSKKTINIAPSVVQGGVYQGQLLSNKQPVLTVGLNPNFKMGETPADLRSKLYGLLTPEGSDAVTVQLMKDDVVIAYIDGYVSDVSPNMFVQEPDIQITIDCDWPYFRAPEPVVIVPDTKDAFVINNVGNARTGFEFDMMITLDRSFWRLFGLNGEVMHFQYDFLFGDRLHFNTQPGSRFISLYRGSTIRNIIASLQSDSTWLMLRGGNNAFTTGSQTFEWGSITYTPQYEGL